MKKTEQDLSIFFAAAATCILGNSSGMKFKGSPDKLGATHEVIVACQKLLEALDNPAVTLNEVKVLLEEKKEKAHNFHEKTGIYWIL